MKEFKTTYYSSSRGESLNPIILKWHCERKVVIKVVATKNNFEKCNFSIFVFPFSPIFASVFLLLSQCLLINFSNFLLQTKAQKRQSQIKISFSQSGSTHEDKV